MNVITASFCYGTVARTMPVYQYNLGMVLQLEGLELSGTFRADFALSETGTSKSVIGANNAVQIPYEYFVPGTQIHCWIVLSGDSYTVTRYHVVIPVDRRATPTEEEPTPEEQAVIDQLIAALNAAVEQTGADVEAAGGYAEEAEQSARAAAGSASSAQGSETAAQGHAEDAAASAAAAQTAEGNAGAYAQDAADSAAAAAQSAASAAVDADRAEQAAATAGYLDVEIVDEHLIYTRTDAVDVDFDLVDGHLLMEVI